MTLEIGFRCVMLSDDWSSLRLDHTPHHEWVFETAFSSNDEVIADALCVCIVGGGYAPFGSYARCLAKRVERDVPFSPRLRQASIRH